MAQTSPEISLQVRHTENDPWIRGSTEVSSYALSGLVHIGALTQGSALRLHPYSRAGLNSYAASRLG